MIGGYAVIHHGYFRTTNDLDIWVRPTPENAERVVKAIREFGFDVPMLNVQQFVTPRKIVRFGLPPARIEVLNSISGITFDDCYGDCVTADINGVEIPVISLKHLKENKSASGRMKDLADLDYLP